MHDVPSAAVAARETGASPGAVFGNRLPLELLAGGRRHDLPSSVAEEVEGLVLAALEEREKQPAADGYLARLIVGEYLRRDGTGRHLTSDQHAGRHLDGERARRILKRHRTGIWSEVNRAAAGTPDRRNLPIADVELRERRSHARVRCVPLLASTGAEYSTVDED